MAGATDRVGPGQPLRTSGLLPPPAQGQGGPGGACPAGRRGRDEAAEGGLPRRCPATAARSAAGPTATADMGAAVLVRRGGPVAVAGSEVHHRPVEPAHDARWAALPPQADGRPDPATACVPWASLEIVSPYDGEARYSQRLTAAGQKSWIGYRDHQTETRSIVRCVLIAGITSVADGTSSATFSTRSSPLLEGARTESSARAESAWRRSRR
jgi:hypothetical protein